MIATESIKIIKKYSKFFLFQFFCGSTTRRIRYFIRKKVCRDANLVVQVLAERNVKPNQKFQNASKLFFCKWSKNFVNYIEWLVEQYNLRLQWGLRRTKFNIKYWLYFLKLAFVLIIAWQYSILLINFLDVIKDFSEGGGGGGEGRSITVTRGV